MKRSENKNTADEYISICNFMEYKILDHSAKWLLANCKFKISWDELMPVVKKIERLEIEINGEFKVFQRLLSLPIYTGIEKVYTEAVKFIEWYNSENI